MQTKSQNRSVFVYNYPGSELHRLLTKEMGDMLMNYETRLLTLVRRRLFATSQALSVATNAVLLQLNCAIEGFVDAATATSWVEHGLLIIFEGLLSVVDHERSMLEDTISAIDALKKYEVRVVEATPGSSVDGNAASFSPGGAGDALRLTMAGREICVHVPSSALAKLPAVYRQGEGVIRLVPVLFSQGIDIQQWRVNTFGSGVQKGGQINAQNLQAVVNHTGITELSDHCWNVLPISGLPPELGGSDARRAQSIEGSAAHRRSGETAAPVHPLVRNISTIMLSSDISAKNVDLLAEVERVCVQLKACRVTFCKSGKDRTGMAVTLEQARQLGDKFNLGSSSARVLRDATLMRTHGTRLDVCEKNIGKRVYSINSLQTQFLPPMYRPSPSVLEDWTIGKKTDLS
jgi:hypothetical protein